MIVNQSTSNHKVKNDTNIQDELRAISPWLANLPKRNVFVTPANYFEKLNASYSSPSDSQTDLEPIWMGGSKLTPFGVPEAYFDTLAAAVLDSINQQVEEAEPVFNKITAFSVPEGYFDSLTRSVIHRASLSPLSEAEHLPWSKQNAFETPVGYFDTLTDSVMAKAKGRPEAKVVSLMGWVKQSKYIIGVAATVLAIVFGINHFNTKVSNSLAETELTAQDISEYLNNNPEEYDEQMLLQKVAEKNVTEEQQIAITEQEALKKEIETNLLDELDENTLNQSL